jgi:small subunit ribosomal protein S20
LANIASAEKRNRQRIRRRARSLAHLTPMRTYVKRAVAAHLTPMRTYVKRAVAALGTKDAGKIAAAIKLAVKHIDKAAQKGVIKKMTASRKISRLVRAARAVSAQG